ncbi:hypothetical protein GGR34_000744 [Microvirga flocculans]|uniref:Uncharacterized protein n=1 Tax=Microvirga flocculans TaxID=217168 RepID=A0A7W6ICY4_9HYPH|nr:hypothetical protein [Microvirga flocculans]MBB4039109.1 hypothetical protein [Microvirga flocculans]
MTQLIIDSDYAFGENADGLFIEHKQEITQSFLDRLKEARNGSTQGPAGEFHLAASIPTVVYEKWLREGYDVAQEPISKTLAKLRAEHLDYFIATDKRL